MPAVLVHGVPDTPHLWDGVRARLSRSDVITPSLPGFASPLPDGFDATKESYVDWLIGMVESVGEPVDIVGHDWGSILVQRTASLRPDLVRTWAVGSGIIDRDYVWHELAQLWQTPEVGEQIMEAMTGEALTDALADGLGRDRAEAVASRVDDRMKDCVLRLYRSAAGGFAEWHDDVDRVLPTRPGLVFAGADDPYVTGNFGERLAQRTNASFEVFPDSGHWWPATKPAEAAAALEKLWASV